MVVRPLTATEADQLDTVADGAAARYKVHSATLGREEALEKTAADLGAMAGVSEVSASEHVVSWTMDSGIGGHFTAFPPGTKGGGLKVPQEPSALILDPYAAEFGADAQGKVVGAILTETGCPRLEPVVVRSNDENRAKNEVTLDYFRTMHRFGVVFIDSHGYEENGRVYIKTFVPFAKQHTTELTSDTLRDLRVKPPRLKLDVDFANGKVVKVYSISPEFVRHYNRFARNSLVHVGSCEGAANASMARAFLGSGAAVYSAYTGVVDIGWGKSVATSYFKELREARTVAEAAALTQKRHGKFDPYFTSTRLVYNPSGRDNRIVDTCSGYTRIIDNVDHPQGTGPSAPRVTGKTVFLSIDTIAPDVAGAFVMRRGARQCVFSKRVPTGFGELQSLDTGQGGQDQDYPVFDPFKIDPDVRYAVKKLAIDRNAKEVKLWPTPEGARRSQDKWVTWLRWDLQSGTWSEEQGCPFEGAIGAIPGFNGPSDYIVVSGGNVTITDEAVEGTVSYSNDKGTGQVVFRYDLKGKK